MLCEEEMKYSGSGLVMSCHTSVCWSLNTALSVERRKDENASSDHDSVEISSIGCSDGTTIFGEGVEGETTSVGSTGGVGGKGAFEGAERSAGGFSGPGFGPLSGIA